MNTELFISKITINKIRHLKNIEINLGEKTRKNLIITGRNGSGKTSLLNSLKFNLDKKLNNHKSNINSRNSLLDNQVNVLNLSKNDLKSTYNYPNKLREEPTENNYGLNIKFNTKDTSKEVIVFYKKKGFLLAYYPAMRMQNLEIPTVVERIETQLQYKIYEYPSNLILKYMVHLKTQLSYAKEEHDDDTVNKIRKWFENFENSIQNC
ncbi:MAG: AAA family ATPase [Desulfovibrionaceae bacterium]|nr:AAA family ATPase [Desulfovibrionaceae bacterium]